MIVSPASPHLYGVVENDGFSAAARNLNVSPTRISDQVQALDVRERLK